MSTEKKLKVTEIQRFCMHDGPGIRTTVFFKGCPLRCEWCHNPETQKAKSELLFYEKKCIGCGACLVCENGAHRLTDRHEIDRDKCVGCGRCAEACPTCALELCGREYTVDELIREIEKDRAFYGETGGITLSGGEPFVQGELLVELLRKCKARGINTAVETCGYVDGELLRAALPHVDLFLWDVKDTDSKRHRRYTGVPNDPILRNLALINERMARIRLRCILVNGVNTDTTHYSRLAELALSTNELDGIEIIPYHAYGGTKSTFIGRSDSGRADWIPDGCQINSAKEFLRGRCLKVL